MKSVLYISNVEVPYRNEFFNQLAQKYNLTVLYEKNKSVERNEKWAKSIEKKYKVEYLNGIHIGGDNYFSFKIFKYLVGKYDVIIIGCYNSLVQSMAILFMRIMRKKFIINLDGEIYLRGNSFKTMLKKIFLKGATQYLVAGNSAKKTLGQIVDIRKVTAYPFSSLTKNELNTNLKLSKVGRNGILVVGQYYDYKGLDIAVNVAKKMTDIEWIFVGMGKQTELFCREQQIKKYENIKVIPFLQKRDLYNEYRKSRILVLPSRQECWGLVVNEAASVGTPIVATWGSGAAVEFLEESPYKCFLADADNVEDLEKKIRSCLANDSSDYERYLMDKSKYYTIENCVSQYSKVIDEC